MLKFQLFGIILFILISGITVFSSEEKSKPENNLLFLGFESSAEQHYHHSLSLLTREILANHPKVFLVSHREILSLKQQGVLTQELPNAWQRRKLTRLYGPMIAATGYLRKPEIENLNLWEKVLGKQPKVQLILEVVFLDIPTGDVLYNGTLEIKAGLRGQNYWKELFSNNDKVDIRLFEEAVSTGIKKLSRKYLQRLNSLFLSLSKQSDTED